MNNRYAVWYVNWVPHLNERGEMSKIAIVEAPSAPEAARLFCSSSASDGDASVVTVVDADVLLVAVNAAIAAQERANFSVKAAMTLDVQPWSPSEKVSSAAAQKKGRQV